MNNIGLSFTLRLVILLSVAFLIHSGIQHWSGQGSFENHIIATYLFNFVLAILFFFVLLYYKKKKSTQLGFIFLFSSALKLGVIPLSPPKLSTLSADQLSRRIKTIFGVLVLKT